MGPRPFTEGFSRKVFFMHCLNHLPSLFFCLNLGFWILSTLNKPLHLPDLLGQSIPQLTALPWLLGLEPEKEGSHVPRVPGWLWSIVWDTRRVYNHFILFFWKAEKQRKGESEKRSSIYRFTSQCQYQPRVGQAKAAKSQEFHSHLLGG